MKGNYRILREYIKYVFTPLTEVVGLTNYERREYIFNVFSKYFIISVNEMHVGGFLE